MSNAAATLVGQNLGAGHPERAEKAVWRTGLYNVIFLGSVGLVFIFFSEPIVRLFTHDPDVVPLGAACLRIISYGNLGYAYFMVMMQAFNGAGDTITPTIVNFFGFWIARDSAGVLAGHTAAHAFERSLLRHRHRRECHGRRQRNPVQARQMEEAENLEPTQTSAVGPRP